MAEEVKGFANLMRYCNTLEDYNQKKADGKVTDDVLVIVLEDKVIKFKGYEFDLSGKGSGEGGSITIDDVLSATSTNPVTSKAIKEYVDLHPQYERINEIEAPDINLGGGGLVTMMTEVTYAELVTLRDDGALIPGMHYRITDYETMTSEIGVSAEHPFDIIVTAISNNVIDEKARAIQSARDITGYFANSNLASWEVWYCLDNNRDRFINASVASNILVIQLEGELFGGLYDGTIEYDGKSYFSWSMDMGGDSIYFLAINETPQTGDDVVILFGGEFLGNASVAKHLLMKDGKGVIYRLIDECGNDIPYDFKNIMFERPVTDGEYDIDNPTLTPVYTFTLWNEDGSITDLSLQKKYCHDNVMRLDCFDNVFLTKTGLLSNPDAGCHNNVMGENCINNTMGDQCYRNTWGSQCSNNIIDYGCDTNIFGHYFDGNIVGHSCAYNVFGSYCFRNNIGAVFQFNRIEDGCYENIFGTDFCHNELGEDCIRNTFAKTADGQELALNTRYCILGKGCSDNIIYGDRTYPDSMRYVHIEGGISGTESEKNVIKIPVMSASYVQKVARNSNGEIKIYCEADLIQ